MEAYWHKEGYNVDDTNGYYARMMAREESDLKRHSYTKWAELAEAAYQAMNTWTTADGRTLLISEMDTDHIRNCITHLKERKMSLDGYILKFQKELNKRQRNEKN